MLENLSGILQRMCQCFDAHGGSEWQIAEAAAAGDESASLLPLADNSLFRSGIAVSTHA